MKNVIKILLILCFIFELSTNVGLSFLFVRFVLYLCDSFSFCATQLSICVTPFIFVRFALYLCDSFCICAIRFVFVRGSCGPPYK